MTRSRSKLLLVSFFCAGLAFPLVSSATELIGGRDVDVRPNFLIILADDLGYSDIELYGGPIGTPNLTELARQGSRFSNFYAAPTCGPSRAMLLTGVSPHLAGFGVNAAALQRLPELRGKPGYEGYLNDRVLTIPEILQQQGYYTAMTGKWDLGGMDTAIPADRGFERSFALLDGGASHFSDMSGQSSAKPRAAYVEDRSPIAFLPDDFYSSTFYVDRLIDYLRPEHRDDRPFFAYLAFTAPHWPLQVPDEWLDRYRGRFDSGWDALREEKIANLTRLGLINEMTRLPDILTTGEAWASLSATEKKFEARRMELHAAMVSHMDQQIGRFLDFLKDSGQYENTFVLFLSDNGIEGNNIEKILDNDVWIPSNFDNRFENLGRVDSYIYLGSGWAQVSSLPHRLYKAFPTEGGIRVPAILKFPNTTEENSLKTATVTTLDIAPTIMEMAGVEHPAISSPSQFLPPEGVSMVPYLTGESSTVRTTDDWLAWETYGNRAVVAEDWKITLVWPPFGQGEWRLFNLSSDPAETTDLSEEYPEVKSRLLNYWDEYVQRTGLQEFSEDMGYGREE